MIWVGPGSKFDRGCTFITNAFSMGDLYNRHPMHLLQEDASVPAEILKGILKDVRKGRPKKQISFSQLVGATVKTFRPKVHQLVHRESSSTM